MTETAQEFLERRTLEFRPAIHEHARMLGLLPPYRFHMMSVAREVLEDAGNAIIAGGICRAAFRQCCEKLGVGDAERVDIPDHEARLHWIAAVTGTRPPPNLVGRLLRGLWFGGVK